MEWIVIAIGAVLFVGVVIASIRTSRKLDVDDVGLAILPNLVPDETTAYFEPQYRPNEVVEYTENRGSDVWQVGVVQLEQWAGVLIRTIDFLPGGGFIASQRTVYCHRSHVRKLDRTEFDSHRYPTKEIAGWGK